MLGEEIERILKVFDSKYDTMENKFEEILKDKIKSGSDENETLKNIVAQMKLLTEINGLE